jgi:hypothetical protein
MARRGVVYCAVHSRLYFEAAIISAFALRQLEPQLPIVLVTDQEEVDAQALAAFGIAVKFVEFPQMWRSAPAQSTGQSPEGFESRLVKTSLPDFTEFEETLYLDADVLPILPFSEIWQFLEQGELALKLDVHPQIGQCDHVDEIEKTYTLQRCSANTPHYNGGVILWNRTPQTTALFQAWKQEWMVFKQHDQLALVRSLQTQQMEVVQLPEIYNFPAHLVTKEVVRQNQVRLLHCLRGFVRVGRFQQVAQRLMPISTQLALRVLGK